MQSQGEKQLLQIDKTLKQTTDQIPDEINWIIQVEGHTDKRPIQTEKYPSNWELSGARAAAVVRQLINMEVNPTRLQAVGFAEYIPRDRPTDRVINDELIKELNETREQKARNRRVEITFLASTAAGSQISKLEEKTPDNS